MDQIKITVLKRLLCTWKHNRMSSEFVNEYVLQGIIDIVEYGQSEYLKKVPDPLNDNNRPTGVYIQILQNIFRTPYFVKDLMESYIKEAYLVRSTQNSPRVTVMAFRLFLGLIPGLAICGLSISKCMSDEFERLYSWIHITDEPLTTYATGILAHAREIMDFSNIESNHKILIPKLLDRLHKLFEEYQAIVQLNSSSSEEEVNEIDSGLVYPINLSTKQIFILMYLSSALPLNKHSALSVHIIKIEHVDLIVRYIKLCKTKNIRLAFEALKYLGVILTYARVPFIFLNLGGLKAILDVPRSSIAETAVSYCFYRLVCNIEVAMHMCRQSNFLISEMTAYTIYLLESRYESSRTNAIKFFCLMFPFKGFIEEFDGQGGLTQLVNMMLELRIPNELRQGNLEKKRYILKNCMYTLKQYFDTHLYIKAEQLEQSENSTSEQITWTPLAKNKPCRLSADEVEEKIKILQTLMPTKEIWEPAERFHDLGGTKLITNIILKVKEFCHVPVVRKSFLEILKTCFHILGILSIKLNHEIMCVGVGIVIHTVKFTNEASLKLAGLQLISNYVCAPLPKDTLPIAEKMRRLKEINYKWKVVRHFNGMQLLVDLVMLKSTRDTIRALACKALAGLARSDDVRKMLLHMPAFAENRIKILTKDPILQGNKKEHKTFKTYALKLFDTIFRAQTSTENKCAVASSSSSRYSLIEQMKLRYKDEELLEKFYKNLMLTNLEETPPSLQYQENVKYQQNNTLITHAEYPCNYDGFKNVLEKSTPRNIFLEKYFVKPSSSNVQDRNLPTTSQLNGTSELETSQCSSSQPQQHEPSTSAHSETSITKPHNYFDAFTKSLSSDNIVDVYFNRPLGSDVRRKQTRYVFSHFKPVFECIGDPLNKFCSCCYARDNRYLIAGTDNGIVNVLDTFKSLTISEVFCHESDVYDIQLHNSGNVFLTAGNLPATKLYAFTAFPDFKHKYTFHREKHVEFSKLGDRIIGTNLNVATIYDVNTCQHLMNLNSQKNNNYLLNRATFSYDDDMVLHNGVLFDVNSGKTIRKLEKLNDTLNGVFHPNTVQIVSNMEVWDIRTFKLIKTVPALELVERIFSPIYNTIYTFPIKNVPPRGVKMTQFNTIDPFDYSNIVTFDVKQFISDVTCNKFDTQIAVTQYASTKNNIYSVIKIYDVGGQINTDNMINDKLEESDETAETSSSDESSEDN